jgi:PAS domain S-box-containing protein
MSTNPAAAERLRASKTRVLELWERAVRNNLPAARASDSLQLRDSLPEFIDQLVSTLSPGHARTFAKEREKSLAVEHGLERSGNRSYDLLQVLQEYHLLRQVIFDVLRPQGPLSEAEQDTILEAIQIGVRNASTEFVRSRQWEARQLSREYRRTSENLRLIVEGVQDHAIIQSDPSGIVVSWNSGAERLTGWRRDEMIGRSDSILSTPEDLAEGADQKEMRFARETGKAEDNRWHRRRDGSRFFAMGVTNPLKDASGEVLGYVKVLRDQTKVKERQEELRAREEELRDFIMQSPAAMVIVVGSEHRFTVANPAYERLVGRKVAGKTVREAFTADEAAHFVPLLDGVYRTGKPYVGKELPLKIADESGVIRERFADLGFHPFRDPGGRIKGILADVHDVTGQVRARREVAFERHQLETIFRESPAAMALWRGPDLVFDLVNPRYQAIFPDRELLGKPFLEAVPEFVGQPFADLIRRVLETGEPFVGNEVLARLRRTRGGPLEDVYYDFTYVQVRDPEGQPYGVYDHAIDVTERVLARRRAEESAQALAGAVSRLETERELRERFVATLSHDLRTPLTAAKMSALILIRKPDDADAVGKFAGKIVANIDRGDGMIRDLLDANRIGAGERLPIEVSECDANAVARETLEELATVHGDRFLLMAPGRPIRGYWSRSGIQRILENLCANAVKYGARERKVAVALSRSEPWLRLSVHNWGAPIPPQDQRTLFEPYRRTASAQAGREKGWGLGLTLVKGLAEAQGGSVSVKSSAENGTTFEVRLPLAPEGRPGDAKPRAT